MVVRWVSGERKPGLEWALKLEIEFAIDPSFWHEPALAVAANQ